jgi:hypothetical protein
MRHRRSENGRRPNILLRHMRHLSICKQSGRTLGRLGSSGLGAMPSEGLQSCQSGANLHPPSSPGCATINDDYGPGEAARRWTSPPPPPGSARLARVCCGPDRAAGGRGPERSRCKRTQRLARCTGLGANLVSVTGACAGYLMSDITAHLFYARPAITGLGKRMFIRGAALSSQPTILFASVS